MQAITRQNNCRSWVLVAMRNWKIHLQMQFLVKNIPAHVRLDWIGKWKVCQMLHKLGVLNQMLSNR